MILQLDPMIPCEVVENPFLIPTGRGVALGWIDYSQEDNLIWIVAFNESREIWLVQNPYVRLQNNNTMGRK